MLEAHGIYLTQSAIPTTNTVPRRAAPVKFSTSTIDCVTNAIYETPSGKDQRNASSEFTRWRTHSKFGVLSQRRKQARCVTKIGQEVGFACDLSFPIEGKWKHWASGMGGMLFYVCAHSIQQRMLMTCGIACPVVSAIMASIAFSIFELNASAACRSVCLRQFFDGIIIMFSHLFAVQAL